MLLVKKFKVTEMEMIVNLKEHSYPIYIEKNILKHANEKIKEVFKGKKIMIISDDQVYPLYGDDLTLNLEKDFKVNHIVVPHGEKSKRFDMLPTLYKACLDFKLTRTDLIIALGGGVIGDMAGFVASSYLRGVKLVQIPTSLLAQVDSSVGGKVAVDLPEGKNLVGAFYHPSMVLIDPCTLKTLDPHFISDGMGEVIKYGCIKDKKLFDQLNSYQNFEELYEFIDEKEMMKQVIYEVSSTVDCPLCIDTSHIDVMEEALRIYPGRALINSISLESEKIEKMLPIAKKYGAMFVLLPLSDEGLPKDGEEKKHIIETVYDRAMEMGMAHEDIVVDGLVATIGANPEAARECYETIAYCKDVRKLPTICGLSNISFGLPERMYVNTAFLTMAICEGLTMAIANPSQELLMNAAFASDMLLHRPDSDIRYIERMNRLAEQKAEYETVVVKKTPAESTGQKESSGADAIDAIKDHPIFTAVLKGSKGTILDEVKKALDAGVKPDAIINDYLIAAINEVGVLFDKKKYFLPQLIGSANTMKKAIDYLEPMLERREDAGQMPTLVIATVEGDIHDIGKNLVVLMLKNYGYNVIDMGKDVPCEDIVDTAIREDAAIIGLSALMTTTMMRMQDVVEICKAKGCKSKVIIGGACITQSFADEIGADGYSRDAAECVKLVERLLAN